MTDFHVHADRLRAGLRLAGVVIRPIAGDDGAEADVGEKFADLGDGLGVGGATRHLR